MPVTDWICAVAGLLAATALAAWIWQAAGDTRALEADTDPQLLRNVARHLLGPAPSLPPAAGQPRDRADVRQLHA